MRADAARNRRAIVDSAIELVLEVGGEPSRDAVAARAGVGIATLYRHFPDQSRLLRAVAVEVIDRAVQQGRAALEQSSDGGAALRRYLHAAIDAGLGAVNIVHPLIADHDWPERSTAAREVLDRLLDAAVRDGSIDRDYSPADLALAAIRFSRPLGIGIDPAREHQIAHEQLDRYLDGLTRDRGTR